MSMDSVSMIVDRPLPIILVVDDVRSNRWMLMHFIEGFGYPCISAENGEQAWEIVQNVPAQAVVTDIEMPVSTGIELIHNIRNSEVEAIRELPIFVCSSRADELKIRESASAATGFLAKPISRQRLETLLTNHLGARQSMHKSLSNERRAKYDDPELPPPKTPSPGTPVPGDPPSVPPMRDPPAPDPAPNPSMPVEPI